MDLGTVSQRLESNFYASASAVADDICLVWHNCRAFNEPGSDVFQSCDELSGFFDQQWKQAKLPAPTVRLPLPITSAHTNYIGIVLSPRYQSFRRAHRVYQE